MTREIPKTIISRTSVRTHKLEKELRRENSNQTARNNNRPNKISNVNEFTDVGSRFVAFGKNTTDPKKSTATKKKLSSKEKAERPPDNDDAKNLKRILFTGKPKEELQEHKRADDRDFRRLKSKYNSGVGNILREWVNLVYCILILRMNLIKFIVDKFPDFGQNDVSLQKQIVLESKVIYKIIRKAQHYSQEQFLFMWSHLDKLILNRMILKNALESAQMKDSAARDWKAASEKLTQLQDELDRAQSACKAIQKSKTQFELLAKEKVAKLENLTNTRNTELEQLTQQITELKNNEAQSKAKALLNMKTYRDLKYKKQSLLALEKEMNQLKSDQSNLVKDYTTRIEFLENEVEAKDQEIKVEKQEKQKLKATLAGFGDFSDKRSLISIQEI